ncbi:unnamed protein product [Candida verbasci]|uniref:ER membrane protein complex subunit 1 n=1 Tax=Candida verbasci TaxID=1227364 RepID=A0A9W4TZF4_9ASCO|nr:unnamed protein product [Candida verbasci]
MKSITWLLFIYLFSLVNGILIDDAFTNREYINYLYGGKLTDLNVLNHDLLIGINEYNQLLGIDIINNNKIQWKIKLDTLINEESKLVTSNDRIYIYGKDKEIIEIDSHGQLNFINLSSVAKVVEPGHDGIFVIDSNSQLYYIDSESEFHNLNQVANRLRVDGSYIIIDDSKLIKLSESGSVSWSISISLPSIKQFKSNIIITENDQIFKLHNKKLTRIENDSYKNIHIIDSNYLYSVLDDSIKLINLEKKAKEIKTIKSGSIIELLQTPIHSFLIVSDSKLKRIYDLTDLLESKSPHSIKQISIKDNNMPFNFIGIKNDELGLISINNELRGEFVSLFNGLIIDKITPHNQYYSKNGQYLIIDHPESEEIKHEVEHLLNLDDRLVFSNWVKRVIRHLSELGRFATSINNIKSIFKSSDESNHGFNKLIILFNEKFIAINSKDGSIEWETDVINDEFIKFKSVGDEIYSFFKNTIVIINSRDGKIATRPNKNYNNVINVDGSLVFENEEHFVSPSLMNRKSFFRKVNEFEITGHVILPNTTNSIPTYNLKFKGPIVSISNILSNFKTASIGIPQFDKSVLYKYLNPNLISLITFDEVMKLYVIDGISGSIIHEIEHTETIDPNSVNLIMDDNWIIYSFFTKQPRLEQRINVLDLFNSTIPDIKSQSFIYPERINKLSSTNSLYGITTKSVIAYTESGSLIEIPKYLINSKRPSTINAQELSNDYRLIPYEPIIKKDGFKVINHKYQLDGNTGEILLSPTKYESTSIVCFFNKQVQFCSLIQPSSSFDLLGKRFNKIKLMITVVLLFVVYIVTKPFVFKKKLNAIWI